MSIIKISLNLINLYAKMMIIPIHLDYGAEGAIWYAPFESPTEIIHLKFLERS